MDAPQAAVVPHDRAATDPLAIACWFELGSRVGMAHAPAQPIATQGAAPALRHLLSRSPAAAGTPGAAALRSPEHPAAQAELKPVRCTFPGGTRFKALCDSYLRKLLRGTAPDAVYWVAQATLPDGERVLARLRLTFVVEAVRVETVAGTAGAPDAARAPADLAPAVPAGKLQADWIRELA